MILQIMLRLLNYFWCTEEIYEALQVYEKKLWKSRCIGMITDFRNGIASRFIYEDELTDINDRLQIK